MIKKHAHINHKQPNYIKKKIPRQNENQNILNNYIWYYYRYQHYYLHKIYLWCQKNWVIGIAVQQYENFIWNWILINECISWPAANRWRPSVEPRA